MYFCPISEVPLVEGTDAGRFTRGFALAQWVRRSPEYGAYYRERRLAGDHVILDNGAYENEMLSFRELFSIASSIRPNVLVCPDFIGRPDETRYVSREFIDFWREDGGATYLPDTELMYVLHSRDGETIGSYVAAAERVPDECTWLGLPKRLRVCVVGAWEQPLSRPAVLQELADHKMLCNRQVHLLGVNDMLEAYAAREQGIAVSIDSKKCPEKFKLWR